MKILLFARCKSINGTQTMILRMAKFFKSQGHDIYFSALDSHKEFLKDLSGTSTILDLKDTLINLKKIDVIYCYTEETLYMALFFRYLGITHANILAGVYHPRQYFSSNKIRAQIAKSIICSMPENLVFMNNSVKNSHESFLSFGFSNSNIIPLPINVKKAELPRKIGAVRKIVSIGRLVDFKQGPLFLIETLKNLKLNHKYEYHIYGDGPLTQKIRDKINSAGLSDSVFLHGRVPYSEFDKIMQNAFLFYGMGTSIVEACANGVPSTLEIESDTEGFTYGLYHSLEGYEVGEQIDSQEKFLLSEILMSLDKITPSEYDNLCSLSKNKALKFDQENVGNMFLNLFSLPIKNTFPKFNFTLALKYFFCRIQDRYFYKDGDK